MPDISIKDLRISFGTKEVLKSVNLDIPSAKSMVILGGSGSGKSLLLKTIMGLIPEATGAILIDGKKRPLSRIMENCGMLFQNGALFDGLSSGRNITFGMHGGFFGNSNKKRAIELLGMVDLAPNVADLYPESLSGGMKKRVALARAIALNPHTMLFDEPTTGLDPITAEIINHLILRLIRELSVTAITVTHDMRSVLTIADNIAMIDNGAIEWSGTKDEFLTSSLPLARKFLQASGFDHIVSTNNTTKLGMPIIRMSQA